MSSGRYPPFPTHYSLPTTHHPPPPLLAYIRYIIALIVVSLFSLFLYLFQPTTFFDLINLIADHYFICIISVFVGWFCILASINIMRLIHLERSAKHLIYMKVTLPRQDSKMDQDKRTEKDFKEKLGVMEQLYRALNEIRSLNLRRLIHVAIWQDDNISFEIFQENNKLFFYIVCDPYVQRIIEKQITTFYPQAEVSLEKPYKLKKDKKHFVNGFYLYCRNQYWLPIKTYKNIEYDPLNDLANALSKLEKEETAAIQMVINPTTSDRWRKSAEKKGSEMFKGKKKGGLASIPILGLFFGLLSSIFTGDIDKSLGTNAPGASGGDSYVRMLQTREEVAKHIGEKAGQIGFDVAIRILASSPDSGRVEHILNSMVVSFNVFKDAYMNWFQQRRIIPIDAINGPFLYHAFQKRIVGYFHRSSILTPEELATMYHFPDSRYNRIPIINWLKYKILPPPTDLPEEGIVIGKNRFRNVVTDVRMLPNDRTRHQYIIGKSGSGKSALLSYQARQDIWNGDGVCVVDPHGDLIEDILCYIPKNRVKDTIVFDPSDGERPMGLNLLEAKDAESKDRASLDAMSIFIKLFGDEIFGPRIQHYFRNGCLTLMDDEEEGATLIDVPRLFVDEDFQKYKVSKIKNPIVKSFWDHEMAKTGAREKEEMIPYFSSKFGPFITNTTMRNIIGQTKSAFNIRDIMDERKILLVNLSKGKIGDINAQLLGLIFVNKVNMAAMSRVDMPESKRSDFYMYVDEFQNFATDAFATILSEARKYHLALIMAHQYIAQLTKTPTGHDDTRIRDAVFGNVGSIISFKVGAEDAEYLSKEYAPTLSEQDVIGIANYKAYIKLNINNTTSRPFSIETIWDESAKNEKVARIVKKYSRLKYGRRKEFVDQEICSRIGIETTG